MHIDLKATSKNDDLDYTCSQISADQWAADNEMTDYDEPALRSFLEDDKNILLIAWDEKKIAGMALCYEMPHPEGKNYLYVHELDTHPDYRRQGVATLLMKELMSIAKQRDCSELWLGADQDNPAANEFYKSLNPTEIEPTITYSYKVS